MDVRCTRCGTEYEFDDALISERGTSVRCTQCGFQFKVFPPQLSSVGPDEWVVLTGLGRRVVYRSLRELQNGISKSEVAREDLLARGSKPPRPLGSIAELDPLFATKAAPERQPSTLTGVAPPPQGSTKTANSGSEPGGRPPHDTFSGVAPPPNIPAEIAAPGQGARTGAPLRVGGTRTVLGIGSTSGESLAPNAPLRIPEPTSPALSFPPETQSFEAALSADHVLAPAVAAAAVPVSIAQPQQLTGNSEAPTHRPPPSAQSTALDGELQEPLPLTDEDPAQAGVAVAPELAQQTVPIAIESELASAPAIAPIQVHPEPPVSKPPEREQPSNEIAGAVSSKAVVARVQLERKEVRVATLASDPPTERWAGQPLPKGDAQPRPAQNRQSPLRASGQLDPESTRLVDPEELERQSASNHTVVPKTARSLEMQPAAPRAEKSAPNSKSTVEPAAPIAPMGDLAVSAQPEAPSRAQRPDVATSPPTRSLRKASPAKGNAKVTESKTLVSGEAVPVGATAASVRNSGSPNARFPLGRVSIAVVLLGVGLFAGMKIVGTQLRQPAVPPKVETTAAATANHADPSWSSSVEDRLQVGDASGAEQLLVAVDRSEQLQQPHRILLTRARVLSADLVWWKVQLIGKGAGDAYLQSKQRLTASLDQLKQDFAGVGAEATWPEQLQAAWLDTRKMQGDKTEPSEPALLERLKNPTTAELKYTQLVSTWVRAGVPDDKTIEGLRQLRAPNRDVGPRVVALVVALVQLNRFEDAKLELKGLAAQNPPHPLYDEMLGYLGRAEQAQTANATEPAHGTGAPADSHDAAETDPDLTEGDFRLRLTRASECLSRNELTKAQKLLRSVLAQRPNDTEAIAALGDLMRRRGDMTQARSLYDKALGINGNYLPALSGAADVRWRSGDRAGAAALYRRIVERVGETPGYGQVAAARLKEVEAAPKAVPETAAAPADREPKAVSKDKP